MERRASSKRSADMKPKLIPYLAAVLGFLFCFELFARVNESYFSALADKALLKIKILERTTDARILFVGSSQFLDAIDPNVFTSELQKETGVHLKSFNGATSGLNVKGLQRASLAAVEHEGLTHVVMEASIPSLRENLDFEDIADVRATAENPKNLEETLQNFFVSQFATLRNRKALRPKVMLKLFVLYTADYIDQDIWSRRGTLKQIFYNSTSEATTERKQKYQPLVIRPDGPGIGPETDIQNQVYRNLQSISEIFDENKIQLIWVVPPLTEKEAAKLRDVNRTSFYQDTANKFGIVFYDYSGEGFEEELMADPTHLNADGRKVFSEILAAHLANEFVNDAL